MTVLTDELNFRSGWNVIWMAVLPGAIGWLANGDAGRRAFMAMSLVVLALVTVAAVGVTLGGI